LETATLRPFLGRFCRSPCGSYDANSEPILLQPRHRRSVAMETTDARAPEVTLPSHEPGIPHMSEYFGASGPISDGTLSVCVTETWRVSHSARRVLLSRVGGSCQRESGRRAVPSPGTKTCRRPNGLDAPDEPRSRLQ